MQSVNFFTPISVDKNAPASLKLVAAVDTYFYLGGKKALVILGEKEGASQGTLHYDTISSLFKTCLKVISYCTLILPVLMFFAKCALRFSYKFHLIDLRENLGRGIEISQEALIQAQLICKEGKGDAVWHVKNDELLIFSLPKSAPDLIFKAVPFGKEVSFTVETVSLLSMSFGGSRNSEPFVVEVDAKTWVEKCFEYLVFKREQSLKGDRGASISQAKLVETGDGLIIVGKRDEVGNQSGLLDEAGLQHVRKRVALVKRMMKETRALF